MNRRTWRWTGLLAAVIGLPLLIYTLFSRLTEFGPSLEANELLLPALSLALIVLTLGLSGVLIRNLVKLIVERKRGILGARLRAKLVFFFLALVLLPAIVLFYGSATVIKETVEAIVRTPLEDLTQDSRELADDWTQFAERHTLARARALALDAQSAGLLEAPRATLQQFVDRHCRNEQLQLVAVLRADGAVVRAEDEVDSELGGGLWSRTRILAERVAEERRASSGLDKLGGRLLAHAAVPVESTGTGRSDGAVVAVGLLVPDRIAASAERIVDAAQAYRQFRVRRREMVRFYLTLIALIFVATLFVATWIGFYVSRRITVPLQELAAATREISSGNLDVRVNARVGDEVGLLIDGFNDMAAQLEESRTVITRSTAELRQSNRALDERRRYIETLVANLSTAVVSIDSQGRVATANPAVQRILGLTLAPGMAVREALSRSGLTPLSHVLDELESNPASVVPRDLELSGPTGPIHVAVTVSQLQGRSSEPIGTLLMIEDLTDVLRAQKAAAWQEVARRLAHEIKNPLTPIQLAAQRLRKKFNDDASDLPQVVQEGTASIEREVGSLKTLVDEFSRFARMPVVRPQPVDFDRIVHSVIQIYRGLPGIDWSVELDPEVGRVRLDAQQMRRALINLIDNAIAAMEGRGRIEVVTSAVGRGALHVEIADDGPGIPIEQRDRMFLPYFSTKKRGTGLGLAIVHKVITDHQGTIRVVDNEPRGTRFIIDIAAAK